MLFFIEKLVYQYEEPFADSSQLPTYILAQKTSKYIKVVLSWDWWDEKFAWYDKYNIHLKSKKLKFIPFKKIFAYIFKFFYSMWIKKDFMYKLFVYFYTLWSENWKRHYNYTNYFDTISKEKLFKNDIKKELEEYNFKIFEKIMKWKENLEYLDRILYLDFNNYVPDDIMVKVDIATMANWLESRSPLLDYDFVEYVAKIDNRLKINWKDRKIIFKKMLQKCLKNILIKISYTERKSDFLFL